MLEREVKLPFLTPDEARAAIIAAGASPLRPRRLQDDALFDTGDMTLGHARCILRVRTESGHSAVTLKGPGQGGTMKVRDEHETAVGDGEVLRLIFEALGLHVWFRYQKYREEFGAPGVVIAIDETPVGTFVEIEGEEQAILDTTRALGRTPADFILDSYRTLFQRHRTDAGLTGRDMTFPDAAAPDA